MKCKQADCSKSYKAGSRLFRHNSSWFCWDHLPKVTKDRLPKYQNPSQRPLSEAEAKKDAKRG